MATGAQTKKVLVGLSVKLEVLTKDKLRKFVFGIAKTQENGVDKWSVDFELFDRASATAAFVQALSLTADISLKTVPVENVQATADKGLSKSQIEYVLTTLAADAEKFKANAIKDLRMKRTVSGLFLARDAGA
jgi:hypothetical protein